MWVVALPLAMSLLAQAHPVAVEQATDRSRATGLLPSADVGPIPIVGTVVDAAGKPVAGAELWLTRAARVADERRSGMALNWYNLRIREDETPQVLARVKADGAGKFRLEIPAAIAALSDPVGLAVWATHPGHGAGLRRLPMPIESTGISAPISLALGPPSKDELVFRDPRGKPLAGAKVVPSVASQVPIPAELGEALGSTTDAEGRAVIAGLDRSAIDAVRVTAAGLGTQEIAADVAPPGLPITMSPAGRVAGRLVAPADHREPLRGLAVRVHSRVGGFEGSGALAEALALCDPSGQFEVPAIAAGLLEIRVVAAGPDATPLRALPVEGVVLEPGSTVEREIPLRPTVRVRGEVQEKGTKRPIPGVRLTINERNGGDDSAVSDGSGRWEALIDREVNQPYGWPMRVPAPCFIPAGTPESPQRMPPRTVSELVLPVLELARGVDLPGVVRDPHGKPVANAEVELFLTSGDFGTFTRLARTDPEGRFVFAGVDPVGELKLRAREGSMTSGARLALRVKDVKEPVLLTLRRSRTARLGGRIVDPSGRPVAGATVRVRRRSLDGKTLVAIGPAADEEGATVWRTDADGRYRVGPVVAGDEYTIEAAATGRLPVKSGVILLAPSGEDAVAITPDLVLPGVVAVDGRVVDRAGAAVPGVVVRQSGDGPLRTQATTDEHGRFRLPGFIEGPAFVFASRDGFRRSFLSIDAVAGAGPVSVPLIRTSEPAERTYRSLPPPLPEEESKALARRLFLPFAEEVLAKGTDVEKFRMFRDALAVDPQAVLEKLEALKLGDADLAAFARAELAGALAEGSPDEAAEQAEAGPDADARAMAYSAILYLVGPSDRARALALADQAIVNVRAAKSLSQRLQISLRVADKLIDLGDRDRAKALINEALEIARSGKAANAGGFELGEIAAVLGRLDFPAAMKLMDEMIEGVRKVEKADRTYVFARLYGRLAHKLAADSPADAERVLGLACRYKPDESTRYIVATCARMAAKDPARARRIAETMIIPDAFDQVPWAFGLIADGLAATDTPAASRLLDDSFSRLEALAASGWSPRSAGMGQVAVALLPIVERVAPDRVGEFLARALALRDCQRADKWLAGEEGSTAQLAMIISAYDRELAARILRPALDRLPRLRSLGQQDYGSWRVLAALATIDPKDAAARIMALPDDRSLGMTSNTPRQYAISYTAQYLAKTGKARWSFLIENFLYLYSPDQRYL
ncbi:carboxypeptidase regulatory-like domain-containing protein [Aquisphaera insulae]|uniref:carboxypeptidase regulatory-like domain-containing protein n=1 Tax=Aquisphaera insulae TaxID=2712864 RepID=UPI0013ECDD26|nr:carboxypeptidase regulatory-like domain-containing protein [Aquisphaera insulae]